MLDIFIPQKIQNYGDINIFSNKFLQILENNFNDLKIEPFESKFFEGLKIKSKIFDSELIILCNGEFGENYFLDFDFLENSFDYLGTKIIGKNNIYEKITHIMLNISEVTGILASDKLLTNSKKKEINNKIDDSLFALSGVIYLLYSLKEKTSENLDELSKIKGKVEYEGQAILLSETSITKEIELQASIDKLEIKIELFIDTIKSLIK